MTAESTATPEPEPREPRAVPRIEDAYLDRAIREMHLLEERMDACLGCAAAGTFPVKASGSPTADIMLIKWQSSLSERQEGVSFFGRCSEPERKTEMFGSTAGYIFFDESAAMYAPGPGASSPYSCIASSRVDVDWNGFWVLLCVNDDVATMSLFRYGSYAPGPPCCSISSPFFMPSLNAAVGFLFAGFLLRPTS